MNTLQVAVLALCTRQSRRLQERLWRSSMSVSTRLPPQTVLVTADTHALQIDLESTDEDLQEVQAEISLLSTCASPFVTQYKASFLRGYKLWIVMEYLGGGSCQDLVHDFPNTHLPTMSPLTRICSSNQGSSLKPTSPLSANKSSLASNTYIKRENYTETSRRPTSCYPSPER